MKSMMFSVLVMTGVTFAACGETKLPPPAEVAAAVTTTEFEGMTAHSRSVDGVIETVLVRAQEPEPIAEMRTDLETGAIEFHPNGVAGFSVPALTAPPTLEQANETVFELWVESESRPDEVAYESCGENDWWIGQCYDAWTSGACTTVREYCCELCSWGSFSMHCIPDGQDCTWWNPWCWAWCF